MGQFEEYRRPGSTNSYAQLARRIENGFYCVALSFGIGAVITVGYWIYQTECALNKKPVTTPAVTTGNQQPNPTLDLDSRIEMIIETRAGKEESEKK